MTDENKTADKAQEALDQLQEGKKTINQVRESYGLHQINCCDVPVTKLSYSKQDQD